MTKSIVEILLIKRRKWLFNKITENPGLTEIRIHHFIRELETIIAGEEIARGSTFEIPVHCMDGYAVESTSTRKMDVLNGKPDEHIALAGIKVIEMPWLGVWSLLDEAEKAGYEISGGYKHG